MIPYPSHPHMFVRKVSTAVFRQRRMENPPVVVPEVARSSLVCIRLLEEVSPVYARGNGVRSLTG
ncbi:hypothetical protein [Corynebacterium sp. CCM 9203]|uniref:hypothetical protein n=1 Tax=Corynebacterium sp. CCM 9203 TaxID=3057615 RepID=UPI0035243FD2